MRCVLLFLFVFQFMDTFSQKFTLEVYSITEYVDGFVIKGNSSEYTITIVSLRDSASLIGYENLKVGHKYTFELYDIRMEMSPMPLKGFVYKISNTVLWKEGDNIEDFPLSAKNLNGRFIKQ